MKPNVSVSTAEVVAVNWVFPTDDKGQLSTGHVSASALLECVKALNAHTKTLDAILVALRALDPTSLADVRAEVRQMLADEFGLVSKGDK